MKKLAKVLLYILIGILGICLVFAVANRVNARAMHEYIDTFGEVEFENQPQPQYDENGVAMKLKGVSIATEKIYSLKF